MTICSDLLKITIQATGNTINSERSTRGRTLDKRIISKSVEDVLGVRNGHLNETHGAVDLSKWMY